MEWGANNIISAEYKSPAFVKYWHTKLMEFIHLFQ
jgi:hypothetical protein